MVRFGWKYDSNAFVAGAVDPNVTADKSKVIVDDESLLLTRVQHSVSTALCDASAALTVQEKVYEN